MASIFEINAQRTEQEKYERYAAQQQGRIPGNLYRQPGPTAPWFPITPQPSVTVDFNFYPTDLSVPREPVRDDSSDVGKFWEWVGIVFGGMVIYSVIAHVIAKPLEWLGMRPDLALNIGMMWLPIIAAIAMLVITYRALRAAYEKAKAVMPAVRAWWGSCGGRG